MACPEFVLSLPSIGDGREVTTIEGLAKTERQTPCAMLRRTRAVQCGFCTPMIMQADQPAAQHPHADAACVKRGIEGNLVPLHRLQEIVDAIVAVAKRQLRISS